MLQSGLKSTHKVLRKSGGLLIGFTSIRAVQGEAVFYDGGRPRVYVDLSQPYPPVCEGGLECIGYEIGLKFEGEISVEYPKILTENDIIFETAE